MAPLPKLLPWIARKAGISDATAADLWTQAARRAGLRAGATAGPSLTQVEDLLDE